MMVSSSTKPFLRVPVLQFNSEGTRVHGAKHLVSHYPHGALRVIIIILLIILSLAAVER